ncbi:MAG: GNAT family N-acetyltransferase [Candidatus Marinimicrobia bacterium]|nr:GNAT family N-acetyltransferase [Candidatus Neomarinimicrobiota bacterium]|tara:strand:- start:18149 stop:18583 length:435 start_codon:yes stop_codon:yes gene_type:complete
MNIKIKRISTKEALLVRAPVLRKNQPPEWASMEEDKLPSTIHFGGFLSNNIVGTATVYPENRSNNQNEWRLRGMAVLDKYQSNGIGEILLNSCFDFIKSKNGKSLWCNARIGAVKFYKKCGFSICSKKFNIINIGAHFRMEKSL